jgi:hypothetical protein
MDAQGSFWKISQLSDFGAGKPGILHWEVSHGRRKSAILWGNLVLVGREF